MNRKLLLFVACIVLIIVSVVAVFLVTKKDVSTIETTSKDVSNPGLTIKNFSNTRSGVSMTQSTRLEAVLYSKIGNNGQYTGWVRGDKYTRTYANGYTNIDFLVDIPAKKQTYHVYITIDGPDNYRATNILCPNKTEVIYPDQSCKDFRDA